MTRRPYRIRVERELTFEKLSPRDFERLCLGLISREGYREVEHIGAAGTDGGIDITARRDGRRIAFQCKNVRGFGPADALKAVEKVLASTTENRPAELVFLIACDVSANTRKKAQAQA